MAGAANLAQPGGNKQTISSARLDEYTSESMKFLTNDNYHIYIVSYITGECNRGLKAIE